MDSLSSKVWKTILDDFGITKGQIFSIVHKTDDCLSPERFIFNGVDVLEVTDAGDGNTVAGEISNKTAQNIFDSLLYGGFELRVANFVPKYREKYFFLTSSGNVSSTENLNRTIDCFNINCGNCYKSERNITRREAEKQISMFFAHNELLCKEQLDYISKSRNWDKEGRYVTNG